MFGKLVGGMKVLKKMEQTPTKPGTSQPEVRKWHDMWIIMMLINISVVTAAADCDSNHENHRVQ